MRLVFFGSGDFGAAMLEALLAGAFAPVLVVTRPPRRRRRRGREEPTAVHARASAAGIDVATPVKVNAESALERLREARAELFVVAEYGQILGRALLAIPPQGSINVHTSLLPRWRGATPVAAAILHGDTETGVTIQRVVRELDAGPVLAARAEPILPDDTAGTLTARLEGIGRSLLIEVVAAFAEGRPPPERPQSEDAATFCKRHAPEDARIDWSLPAVRIERMIRAFHPKPGAHARLSREPPLLLDLRRAAAVAGRSAPGVVAAVAQDHFDVGTGDGLLRVLELVPASRRPMEARAFLNGYRLREGERLDA